MIKEFEFIKLKCERMKIKHVRFRRKDEVRTNRTEVRNIREKRNGGSEDEKDRGKYKRE